MPDLDSLIYVDSPLSIRQLLTEAYLGVFFNRFQNADRDVKHRAKLESVIVWKVRYRENTPQPYKVHTYRLRIFSVSPDGEVHNYPLTILTDYLSIDAPVKIRCGNVVKYTDKASMLKKGICGDFRFRFEQLYKRMGILYHRDTTDNRPAYITNPGQVLGCCKHIIGGLRVLIKAGWFYTGPKVDDKDTQIFMRSLR